MWPFKKQLPTTKVILSKALKLIEPEDAWIKGTLVKDANGENVTSNVMTKACKFCPLGAIYFAINTLYPKAKDADLRDQLYYKSVEPLRKALRCYQGKDNIAAWNDRPETTHEEVLSIFNHAIIEYT